MDSETPRRGPSPLPPRLRFRVTAATGSQPRARWQTLEGGRSARSYLLTDRTGALVVKLARQQTGARLFPIRPDVEHAVMLRLAPYRISAAPLVFFRHGPEACLVYRHLTGRACPAPDAALARLLARLHALPVPHPGRLPRDAGPLPALIDRACRHLAASSGTDHLVGAIRAAAMLPPPRARALLHGDPVPGNVIRTATGPALIDWQCARLGEPCRDLALALSPAMQVIHGLPPLSREDRESFLHAYGDPAASARLAHRAAAFHAEMIGHCLWRLERGDTAYAPALRAECAALRALTGSENEQLQYPGNPEGDHGPSPGPKPARLP
jgi:aminoglycoside phosphotransferase (APT) family kinase protein